MALGAAQPWETRLAGGPPRTPCPSPHPGLEGGRLRNAQLLRAPGSQPCQGARRPLLSRCRVAGRVSPSHSSRPGFSLLSKPRCCPSPEVLAFGKGIVWSEALRPVFWGHPPPVGRCLGGVRLPHSGASLLPGLEAGVPGRPALHPNLFLQAQSSFVGKSQSVGKSSVIALELRRLGPGVGAFAYHCVLDGPGGPGIPVR